MRRQRQLGGVATSRVNRHEGGRGLIAPSLIPIFSVLLLLDFINPSTTTGVQGFVPRTAIFGARSQRIHDSPVAAAAFVEEADVPETDDHSISDSPSSASDEATLRSVTFCNLPKDQEPDILCDFMMEIGACAAYIIVADRGTDLEQPLFRNLPQSPWQDTLEWAAPLWSRCNVTAHFPDSTDIEATVALIRDMFSDSIPLLKSSYSVEQVPNRDWVVHVQQGWKPIVVANKYVLRFPWHTDEDVADVLSSDASCNSKQLVQLQLQGGIAFGTGEHPTTQLCLEWLHDVVSERLMQQDDIALSVLDYGSGSGVLGMAACALDPQRVQAVGIDIDVDSCRIANANAIANDLPMRNYLPPLTETSDHESKSLLLKAHAYATRKLAERRDTGEDLSLLDDSVNTQYDVCVANILAGPLVTLAPTLAAMVKPGSYIGMSGILHQQGDMVVAAYAKAGFENVKVDKQLGEWVLVTAQRSNSD